MMSMITRIGISTLMALTAAAAAATDAHVPEYTAQYELQYKGRDSGEAEFSVTYDDARDVYTFESRAEVKGLMLKLLAPHPAIDHSEFKVVDGTLRPLEFRYQDGSRKGEDNYTANFDWASNRVEVSREGGPIELELEPGVLDRGSLQVALMRDVAAGRMPGPYIVADDNSLDTYEFSFIDDAEVDTPLGRFTARRVKQQRQGSSRYTLVWMVPELEHVPVLIEQYRDDELRTAFVLQGLQLH